MAPAGRLCPAWSQVPLAPTTFALPWSSGVGRPPLPDAEVPPGLRSRASPAVVRVPCNRGGRTVAQRHGHRSTSWERGGENDWSHASTSPWSSGTDRLPPPAQGPAQQQGRAPRIREASGADQEHRADPGRVGAAPSPPTTVERRRRRGAGGGRGAAPVEGRRRYWGGGVERERRVGRQGAGAVSGKSTRFSRARVLDRGGENRDSSCTRDYWGSGGP